MAAIHFPVFSASSMNLYSDSRRFSVNSPLLLHLKLKREFLGEWIVGGGRNSVTSIRRKRALGSIVAMLPTANPERTATKGKLPNWSHKAIKSFGMAELQARKLRFPYTGTDGLLLGILVEGMSFGSKFLWNYGITSSRVRQEVITLLDKGITSFPISPEFTELVPDILLADITEHPPLTETAQRVLDWAVDEKIKSGKDGEVTVSYLLLGIWSEKDDVGHRVLAALGFDDTKAQELANSMKDLAVGMD